MTLFGFCIEINGQLFEAAAWGLDVDDAFSVLHERFDLNLQASQTNEFEYCALAFFESDIDLVWWLESGEA